MRFAGVIFFFLVLGTRASNQGLRPTSDHRHFGSNRTYEINLRLWDLCKGFFFPISFFYSSPTSNHGHLRQREPEKQSKEDTHA